MTVLVKKFRELPPPDRREAMRYAGVLDNNEGAFALFEECTAELEMHFGVCYTELPLEINEDTCIFGNFSVCSASLAKRLAKCKKALVFCATVGSHADRLISKYSRISPSRAVMISALATERVECLCDEFCKSYAEENLLSLSPRFSPGYGDLPLSFQKELFSLLSPCCRIGVSLGDSLLMSPSKSVTAIVGIL